MKQSSQRIFSPISSTQQVQDMHWWQLMRPPWIHSALPSLCKDIVRMVWKRQPQDLEQHSSEWTCAINCTEAQLFKPFMPERALHLAPEQRRGWEEGADQQESLLTHLNKRLMLINNGRDKAWIMQMSPRQKLDFHSFVWINAERSH